jgi:hypothetical protein
MLQRDVGGAVRFDHSAVAAAKTHKLVKCDAEAADSIIIDATLPRVNNKRNFEANVSSVEPGVATR